MLKSISPLTSISGFRIRITVVLYTVCLNITMAGGAQASNVPTGYRFSPNDDDLVVHYLKKKILGQQLPADVIPTTDVYASSPDKLPLGLSLSYFF